MHFTPKTKQYTPHLFTLIFLDDILNIPLFLGGKFMKKILSILLSLAMLLSITAGMNLTAYADTVGGSCGPNAYWSLNK